jgi:hypothetical protein
MSCLLGHKWDHCRCARCGKVRDEQHIWNNSGSCMLCGKRCSHQFRPINDECKEKCSICGYERQNHDWDGCICRRCGAKDYKSRAHKWEKIQGTCEVRCSVCGEMAVNHDWDRCICKQCGMIRNTYFHDWKRVEDSCEEKCSLCGTTRESHDWEGLCSCRRCGKANDTKGGPKQHLWEPIEGKCEEKCSLCGKTDVRHDWNGCTCRVCGTVRDWVDHKWNFCTCQICGKVRDVSEYSYHDWRPVPGTCNQKCAVCGQETVDYKAHKFQRIPGTCNEKCTVCGKVIEKLAKYHEWNGCVCKICGAGRHEWIPGPERMVGNTGHTVQEYKCRLCGVTQERTGYKDNW